MPASTKPSNTHAPAWASALVPMLAALFSGASVRARATLAGNYAIAHGHERGRSRQFLELEQEIMGMLKGINA